MNIDVKHKLMGTRISWNCSEMESWSPESGLKDVTLVFQDPSEAENLGQSDRHPGRLHAHGGACQS